MGLLTYIFPLILIPILYKLLLAHIFSVYRTNYNNEVLKCLEISSDVINYTILYSIPNGNNIHNVISAFIGEDIKYPSFFMISWENIKEASKFYKRANKIKCDIYAEAVKVVPSYMEEERKRIESDRDTKLKRILNGK